MNKNRERERKGKKERMKGATKEERNRSKLHNMCIYIYYRDNHDIPIRYPSYVDIPINIPLISD